MHRTLPADIQELALLFRRERAGEINFCVDPIQHRICVLGYAIDTVLGVNPRVTQTDDNVLERPLLRSRIQRDGHGHSRAEGGQD